MKRVIGVIGPIGAGKDVVGDYLADRLGLPLFQTSAPLKEICRERGIEPTRQNLIQLGSQLSREHGEGYLAKYFLARAPEACIITGMREPAQIAYLREQSDFTLVSVDADPQLRFERVQSRSKLGEADSLAQFMRRERAENSPPNTQRLFECMNLADHHFRNEGTLDQLYAQVDGASLV